MPITLDGTTGVTFPSGAVGNSALTSGTAVTASGTSIDFIGIPSWVKRITVMFDYISTNGGSYKPLIQLGTASGVVTTGYTSASTIATNTNGIIVIPSTGSGDRQSGMAIISLMDSTTNKWAGFGIVENTAGANSNFFASGSISNLGGTLTRVRITTNNGTDVFNGGTINILYE